tara:strand:+ start:106 stop:384 length:279 start_codon:yes stop_codon:yes gene_type:complete
MLTVIYHPKVRSDLRKVHSRHLAVIRDAIETKLARSPKRYGKPLRSTLKNLRSLRIGNYRVVYAVKNRELIVLVLTIAKRDKVYEEAKKRLR